MYILFLFLIGSLIATFSIIHIFVKLIDNASYNSSSENSSSGGSHTTGMKVGIRDISINKSISARTTGRLTRTFKKSINPFYGKKGTGFAKSPGRSMYNKAYRKATRSVRSAFR